MKIAEALLLRADLDAKIQSLKSRIVKYSVVQEGNQPSEDPDKLLKKVDGVIEERRSLLLKINSANARGKTGDGRAILDVLSERDALMLRHHIIKSAIESTNRDPSRYGLAEIRWLAVLDVEKLQKQADDLSKRIRELNAILQQANWSNEL